MRIAVPQEVAEGERRVALVPEVVKKLTSPVGEDAPAAPEILVQRGSGAGALIPDQHYEEAGARLVDDQSEIWQADVVVRLACWIQRDLINGSATSAEPMHYNWSEQSWAGHAAGSISRNQEKPC